MTEEHTSPDHPRAARSDHLRFFSSPFALAVILVITSVVFSLSLVNGFVWDDTSLVVPNEAYARFDLAAIVLGKAHTLEYLPVRDLSLALDMQLWGKRPFGFHLTNLLLYLAGLAALFAAVRELALLAGHEGPPGPLAFWTTIIFALHPLHAEVVNFITARNTLLASLFLFLSLAAVLRGLREQRPMFIGLALLSYLLAVFSKAIVVFFPAFLLVLFVVLPGVQAPRRTLVLALVGFFAIAAAAAGMHAAKAAATGMMNDALLRYGTGSALLALAKAIQIPFFYLRMLLFPYPLNVEYAVSFTSGPLLARSLLAGALLITALAGAWMVRRRAPLVTLGIAWFLTSLGPVLNLFPTHPVVADRYAYLAVAGFGLLCAYLLTLPGSGRRAIVAPAVLVLALWAGAGLARSLDWRSDLSLWSAAVAVNPDTSRINLANALWKEGRTGEALSHLREERQRKGTHYASHYEGMLLMQAGRIDDAIASFQRSLAEGGDAFREVHLSLAQAFEKKGDASSSLDHYLKSLEAQSVDVGGTYERDAHDGADRMRSQFAGRIAALREGARDRPKDLNVQMEAALFLHRLGLYEEAERHYRAALELDPTRWDVWYNLGLTHKRRKQYAEAVRVFEKASGLNPREVNILNNLGVCAVHLREYQRAEQAYVRALELSPGFFYAAFNLGRLYFVTGDAPRARVAFGMARTMVKGDPAMQGRIDQYLDQLK